MRKNQKYSKEEMYLAIEMWQESGLTKKSFCEREDIADYAFKYWQKKYKKEKLQSHEKSELAKEKFIPIEVSGQENIESSIDLQLEIIYPNGVKINCPSNMELQSIKSLIDL